jgi:hypothetical protein
VPEWLAGAARGNYHDGAVLDRLALAMSRPEQADPADKDDEDSDSGDDESRSHNERNGSTVDAAFAWLGNADGPPSPPPSARGGDRKGGAAALPQPTRVPLCLWCRGPLSGLCPGHQAAFFCSQRC